MPTRWRSIVTLDRYQLTQENVVITVEEMVTKESNLLSDFCLRILRFFFYKKSKISEEKKRLSVSAIKMIQKD